jgi:hypothetical protein
LIVRGLPFPPLAFFQIAEADKSAAGVVLHLMLQMKAKAKSKLQVQLPARLPALHEQLVVALQLAQAATSLASAFSLIVKADWTGVCLLGVLGVQEAIADFEFADGDAGDSGARAAALSTLLCWSGSEVWLFWASC